jgi:hypothetical protein
VNHLRSKHHHFAVLRGLMTTGVQAQFEENLMKSRPQWGV